MNSVALRISLGAVAVALYIWQALVPATPTGSTPPTPEQLAKLSEQVKSLIKAGEFSKALEPAKTLVANFPESPIYLDRLGTIYHHLGRPREEAEQWERYMAVDPTPEDACPHLDHAYLALHDRAAQLKAAEHCYSLDPKNPDLIFTLGHVHEIMGELEKAEELYQSGVKLAPADSDLEIGLGRVRLHLGHTREALAIAEHTTQESPNNPDAYLLLGMCRMSTGETSLARQALEKGATLAENYADIHFLLGRVAESEHQLPQARAQYQRVLQLDPENRLARDRLSGVNQ